MKTDWLFIAQWPGGVTGYVRLTAFTVWECGTRSDGAERETVRGKKRDRELVVMGSKESQDLRLRLSEEEKFLCTRHFCFISREISSLSFWKKCHVPKKREVPMVVQQMDWDKQTESCRAATCQTDPPPQPQEILQSQSQIFNQPAQGRAKDVRGAGAQIPKRRFFINN